MTDEYCPDVGTAAHVEQISADLAELEERFDQLQRLVVDLVTALDMVPNNGLGGDLWREIKFQRDDLSSEHA